MAPDEQKSTTWHIGLHNLSSVMQFEYQVTNSPGGGVACQVRLIKIILIVNNANANANTVTPISKLPTEIQCMCSLNIGRQL